MASTRFKGETAGERLDYSSISDNDMIQLRHKPGTIDDADKGISKANLQSCPFGVSDTAAGTAAKTASLTDSNPDFTLVSGREIVVCFTTANTAGNPTLNFAGSGAIPLYMPNGAPVGAWNAGAWMHLKYFYATIGNSQIQRWILMSQEVDNEVIMASSTTLTGKSLLSGSSIKVMFTADIAGSNTSTVLSLTYNGTAYNVKVGKNGALSNFVASEVSSGVYKYVQAYTTLELAFDGSQFVIIGNPVVLSSADYTIYADGLQRVNSVTSGNKGMVTSNAVFKDFHGVFVGNVRMVVPAFISSSSSRIYFTIPKKIDITKISVLQGIIRTIDGYAVSASGGWIDLNTSDYSISVEYSDDIYTTLSIQAVTPNKWYKANTTTPISNNTPISLQLNITCIA